jgi:hypothetical protein
MLKASIEFFPNRSQRTVLDFVTNLFPFPLALTHHRLQEEMDKQEPVAAVWQLRDAFECLLKFTAALAAADSILLEPNSTRSGEIAGLLLKPTGLSLGDWHTVLELALKAQHVHHDNNIDNKSNPHLPELYNIFFTPKGKRTRLNSLIGSGNCFVKWRNEIFGHGVFDQDRHFYADETLRWLEPLHMFYEANIIIFMRKTSLNTEARNKL